VIFLCGLGSAAYVAGWLGFLGGCLALPAVALGLTIAVLARRDLGKMRRGITDPAGAALTEAVRNPGLAGALLGSLGTAVRTFLWLVCAGW
jgi:hypothetical protein